MAANAPTSTALETSGEDLRKALENATDVTECVTRIHHESLILADQLLKMSEELQKAIATASSVTLQSLTILKLSVDSLEEDIVTSMRKMATLVAAIEELDSPMYVIQETRRKVTQVSSVLTALEKAWDQHRKTLDAEAKRASKAKKSKDGKDDSPGSSLPTK
eukprot:Clim_evm17s230 gene=Clim_evmTU17s230